MACGPIHAEPRAPAGQQRLVALALAEAEGREVQHNYLSISVFPVTQLIRLSFGSISDSAECMASGEVAEVSRRFWPDRFRNFLVQ